MIFRVFCNNLKKKRGSINKISLILFLSDTINGSINDKDNKKEVRTTKVKGRQR